MLVAGGMKMIETRCWPTDHRGPLAIHAAKKWSGELTQLCREEPFQSALLKLGFNPGDRRFDLPFGCVVATCTLEDCIPTPRIKVNGGHGGAAWYQDNGRYLMRPDQEDFGDFSMGRFAWLLSDIKRLDPPVPCTGKQGFFEWNADLAKVPA